MKESSSISPRRPAGVGRRSGRLKVRRRPSCKLGELNQRPGRSQAGPKPSRADPAHDRACGGQHSKQYRHQTTALARALARGAQRRNTIPRGGRLDSWQRTAGGQLVRGATHGRGGESTRPQRREHHGEHQERPGGRLLPPHPHGGLTVLDPLANAKVEQQPPQMVASVSRRRSPGPPSLGSSPGRSGPSGCRRRRGRGGRWHVPRLLG
jgi:hypothetical protein